MYMRSSSVERSPAFRPSHDDALRGSRCRSRPLFARRPHREEFPHHANTPSWRSGHLPEVAARPPSFWEFNRKPTVASEAEIVVNTRTRAASLRARGAAPMQLQACCDCTTC
jgi:hypothetical protein